MLTVCLFTSHNVQEPRAVRHALALASRPDPTRVILVDLQPAGGPARTLPILEGIEHHTCRVPHRGAEPLRRALHQGLLGGARLLEKGSGRSSCASFSLASRLLSAYLDRLPPAEVYVGHNIDALPVLDRMKRRHGAVTIFDSMEFYADMGPEQPAAERERIVALEARCLPRCDLVLASSEQLAAALAETYQIPEPLALYNMPGRVAELPDQREAGLNLYWRNTAIGFGQRGLDEALAALVELPDAVRLHLQGGLSPANEAAVRERIERLGVGAQVVIHPPYQPDEAVRSAARFQVGLCLERDVCRNHQLTVSNKLFDYMMAGLAVVTSDMPSLVAASDRAGGALHYREGDAADLARQIRRLHDEQALLARCMEANRAYALSEGHEGKTKERFLAGFEAALSGAGR